MVDEYEQLGQDEIENLLEQARSSDTPESPADASSQPSEPAALGQDAGQKSATVKLGQSLGQGEIDTIIQQEDNTTDTQPPEPNSETTEESIAQGDIELLLNHAEQALASINQPSDTDLPPDLKAFRFEDFTGTPPSSEIATLGLIRDVELELTIELGRTHMYLEDILKLRKGSVVPLDKLAGDPVDIYANGRLIARGEVLVLNDNFCVRIAELVSGEKPAMEIASA